MKKIQLHPEDLRVETFAPVDGAPAHAGTVEARELPETYSDGGTCYWPTECDSCAPSCPGYYCGPRISDAGSCPCRPEPY